MGAAGKPAALAGEAGADAAAATRRLGSLIEAARVAASALFGVASVIGVVEVAARQWAVAKAKRKRSPREVTTAAPPRKSNRGPGGTHDYSRDTGDRRSRACNTLVTPLRTGYWGSTASNSPVSGSSAELAGLELARDALVDDRLVEAGRARGLGTSSRNRWRRSLRISSVITR